MNDTLSYWLFDRFIPQNLKICSPKTVYQYQVAFNDFAQYLGRLPTLTDLDDEIFAAFAKWLHGPAREICARTTNERLGRLKTCWGWLAKRRIVERFPTVGKLPEPMREPRAWTENEMCRLFNSCRMERGWIDDIPAWRWWFTIHTWWWCTAARVEETLLLPTSAIELERGMAFVSADIRKGRTRARTYVLWPDLVLMLREIMPPATSPRARVFPWPKHIASFYHSYTRLLKRVNLPFDRYSKPHRMRVSRATWTKFAGGDATEALGHLSDRTTRKHYLDSSLLRQDQMGSKLWRPW